ncbi:hypothetical protein [Winogradskyella sediminis]|uniref:hypothetical protein n=1 Tax=Winogradskyella sediminis TaxID=1382466 RepID=UPI003AA807D2
MKNLLIITALILMPLSVFSQQSNHKNPLPLAKYSDNVNLPLTAKERAQIIEAFGDSADKMVFSNPHRLKSIKHILRNRVKVKLITDKNETKPCPMLSDVTNSEDLDSRNNKPFDLDSFNPLKYDFNFHSRSASMYQVDNTNYYIIINSQYQ